MKRTVGVVTVYFRSYAEQAQTFILADDERSDVFVVDGGVFMIRDENNKTTYFPGDLVDHVVSLVEDIDV